MRQGLILLAFSTALLLNGCPVAADREVPSERAPTSRYAEVDDALVHYVEAGVGDEALVLVHGWSCSHEFWLEQIDALRHHVRVIAIDLPGHGASAPPKHGYSMNSFARAIARVLDHAGVRRAVLAGHSNGVPVVRQFYRRYPARTVGLILVDGWLRPFTTEADAERTLAPFRGTGYREEAARWIDGMIPDEMPPARAEFIRSRMLATRQEAMLGGLVAGTDPAIWKLDPIKVPTLVIGADSPWWFGEYRAFADELLPPGTEWHIKSGVSHFLQIDAAPWFNRLVARWIDGIPFPAR